MQAGSLSARWPRQRFDRSVGMYHFHIVSFVLDMLWK